MPRKTWIIALLLMLLLAGSRGALAQDGVAKWLRYDVTITIQPNSVSTVKEVHEISLVSGATTFRREIPADKIEAITNLRVIQQNPNSGGRSYQASDTRAEYTYQVVSEPGQYVVELYFPPNNVPSTTFFLDYSVVGALRFYDTGDRFDWRPFGRKIIAPIDTSNTVINLPAEFAETQITRESTGWDQVNIYFSDAKKVTFIATEISPGGQPEVSVTFPHGVVQGTPPHWQTEADSLEFWTPILQWGSLLLGMVCLVLSLLVVMGWWYLRLRLSPSAIGKVPKYLKAPPSDLSPAVAGTLIDGKPRPRHIMAALLDMAYHGVLNVDAAKKDPSSLLPDDDDMEPSFELCTVDQRKTDHPYEETLFGKIFGYAGSEKRQLSDIRETLFMSVPEIKNQIEFEVAKKNFFVDSISATRRQYLAFGGAGVLLSLVMGLLLVVLLNRFTYWGGCPFFGFTVGAIALMGVGFAIPHKTEAGAKEAARWEAFKQYLTDMGVKDAARIKPRFAQFLPYAVAFGIEKEFVKKFAAANVAVPKWWGKPEKKLPDIGHEQAHAWVSSGFMSETGATAQAKPEKPVAKSVIRRLGETTADAPRGALLKHIKPVFLEFLRVGNETFAKAPSLEKEPEIDFEVPELQ